MKTTVNDIRQEIDIVNQYESGYTFYTECGIYTILKNKVVVKSGLTCKECFKALQSIRAISMRPTL